jgi:hypothetical protein
MGWLVGFLTAWGSCQYISYIIELKTLGDSDLTLWGQLLSPQIAASTDPISGAAAFVNATWSWIQALFGILTWNFAFFTGWLEIVRYLVFIPLSVGVVWMGLSWLRGVNQ